MTCAAASLMGQQPKEHSLNWTDKIVHSAARRRDFDVPNVVRTDGRCRIWHSGWTLSDAGRHIHNTFQSATYGDMHQLLAREATTAAVTVKATLGFPEQVKDHYPIAIVVHTLAGYRDANEGYVAAELRKAGFATLTYDSFSARGTTGAALQGSPGYLAVGVADAYATLRLLSRDSRIDAAHIAIIGFSYGAEVAHLAAFEAVRSALTAGPHRFAAHVSFYPGGTFGAVAEPRAYTGSRSCCCLATRTTIFRLPRSRDIWLTRAPLGRRPRSKL